MDMSICPKAEPVDGHGVGLGEALYFDSGDRKLFGWLHQSSGETFRGIGLVICKPFGYEAICSHKSVRAFAEASAAIGVPALRFDYLGTGDSAEICPRANQLDVWANDVLAAIGEMQRRTGVERVCLLGIRLGAVLATMAAMRCKSVAGSILISPIISGRRYLRELRTTRLAQALGAENSSSGPTNEMQPTNDGSMEVSGFLFSAATLAGLAQLDLTMMSTEIESELLIIDGSSMPMSRGWAEALAISAPRTQYLALPGLIEMIMAMPHDAKPPEAMLAAVRDWLVRIPGDRSVIGEGSNRQNRECDTIQPIATLEILGDESTPEARVTEHPVLIASDPALFGILTEPRQGEVRRRAVILLNAGATYHVGPNREYVSLARYWARHGYFVLRMDLAGLGDSGNRRGHPVNEVFPAAALDDIRAAVEFVRVRYGINDLTLCGICSGAYHSLRASVAAMPVNRILMVNPENYFWKDGTDLNDLELTEIVKRSRDHRERIFSIAAWKRLMSGQVNLLRIVRIYMQRPLVAVESMLRDCARQLRVRLPRDLGWELEEIASRGVRMVFVFARGATGIDLLRIQGGFSVKRLGERCRVHVIDGADHIFSQAGPRAAMEKILSNELFAQNRSRDIPAISRPELDPARIPAAAPIIFAIPEHEGQSTSRKP